MSVNYDVAVVGGGVTGCGVARDLAKRGLEVVLLERGGLSSGTTGRSHCLLHSGARYADTDPPSALACAGENAVLREIAGCCVRETDGYFVELPGDSSGYFEEKLEACREVGVEAEVVSGKEVRGVESSLTSRASRAIRVRDAVVDPVRLVAANAVDARRHGADIRTETEVTMIREGELGLVGDGVSETVEVDHVVNAAGAWAGVVAGLAGYEVDMRPTSGVMVVADHDGLGSVLNRCRPPSDGDIVVPRNGAVVLGTTSREVESPDSYPRDEEEVDLVFRECRELLPDLSREDVLEAYWGVRPLYGDTTRELRDHHLLAHSDWFTSIVGGKLTTYRLMAEEAADHVCEVLGVDAECSTREELPLVDEPTRLDREAEELVAPSPANPTH